MFRHVWCSCSKLNGRDKNGNTFIVSRGDVSYSRLTLVRLHGFLHDVFDCVSEDGDAPHQLEGDIGGALDLRVFQSATSHGDKGVALGWSESREKRVRTVGHGVRLARNHSLTRTNSHINNY